MTHANPGYTVESLGGECPTQAEGRYTDSDRPYYFRARHGRWTLEVGDPGWPTDYCQWPDMDRPHRHGLVAEGDDPTRGAMAHADVLAIIAANVPVVIEGEVAP